MHPEHAIDICYAGPLQGYRICRRKDQTFVQLPAKTDAQSLARAVLAGMGLRHEAELAWMKLPESFSAASSEVVVVWRSQGKMHVGTPQQVWGKVPDVLLKLQPGLSELGQAILDTFG